MSKGSLLRQREGPLRGATDGRPPREKPQSVFLQKQKAASHFTAVDVNST